MELIEAIQSGVLQNIKDIIANRTVPLALDTENLDYAAVHTAIDCEHFIIAEYLLSIGCRVNIDQESEAGTNTPLHKAIILEDINLVEELLERDANILATNEDGNSSLHIAFLNRNDRIVDLLLDTLQRKDAFTNVKNSHGLSHMHIACTRRHNTVVESFVSSGVDLNDCVDENSFLWSGYSALHFAVEFRSINAVKAILKSKVNLTIEDAIQGLTPLGFAQQQIEDLSDIAKLLSSKKTEKKNCLTIEKKQIKEIEEVNAIEKEQISTTGLSSLHMACMESDPKLVEYLLANGAPIHKPVISHIDLFHLCTPLHLAVETKCKRTIEILIKYGADVNLQNKEQMTPLHLSLYVNDHEDKQPIIDYLYAAVQCIRANPKDANGLSYLHIACTRNDAKTVAYLLDIGEDVNSQVQRNSRAVPNFTPLHFAVECRHSELARMLIERGANVDTYSLRGTPLHLACGHGDSTLVGLLLDSGAKVDETMTLHSLLETYVNNKDAKLLEQVEKLVRLGVDVDAKDARGNTALHVFCRSKKTDENDSCLRFLLDLGADVNLENNEGKTAFELRGDTATLYHHVQEMKALGVEVNPKNDECCWRMICAKLLDEETLERKRQQRIDEITCMKSIKLCDYVTLDNFLRMGRDQTTAYADNEMLMTVVSTYDLFKCFPTYAYLVKLQYCRAVCGFGVNKKRKIDWEIMTKRQ